MIIPNKIIITVPHKICPKKNYAHLCDISASTAANELLNEAKELGLNVVLLEGKIHRDYTQIAIDGKMGRDQNRPIGRGSTFRESILEEIKSGGGYVYVIDIHSFSDGMFKNTDIGIMDPMPSGGILAYPDHEWTEYAENAAKFLTNNTNSRVKMLSGSMINDIVVTSRYYGAKSFIIEINESLSDTQRKLAMKQLALWLKNQEEYTISSNKLIFW
jgi:hypothetical protein